MHRAYWSFISDAYMFARSTRKNGKVHIIRHYGAEQFGKATLCGQFGTKPLPTTVTSSVDASELKICERCATEYVIDHLSVQEQS